jgi:DNA-binding NtrC family response regulator
MASPKNKGILIVDDQRDIADLVKMLLEREGYNAHAFYDPFMALDHFRENFENFVLVIADVRMPGMSGIELVSKIKEIENGIIAILISAFERDTIEKEIKRCNVEIAEIFQKPILLKKLRLCVNGHIKKTDIGEEEEEEAKSKKNNHHQFNGNKAF